MKALGKEWRQSQERSIWGRKRQGFRVTSYGLLSVVPETPSMHFRDKESKAAGHEKICMGIGKKRESSWEEKGNLLAEWKRWLGFEAEQTK